MADMKMMVRQRRRLLAAGEGRPANPDGRISRTVYPVNHLLVTGALTTGFIFYGPFDTVAEAGQWATDNLRAGEFYRVHDIQHVRTRT